MSSTEKHLQDDESPIRVVDISAWRDASSTQEERDAVLEALRYSCTTHGFFQLAGHGVTLALQKKVLQCAETFFSMPMEDKMAVSARKSMGRAGRGYETLRWQVLQVGALPDLKEGYLFGTEVPADDPRAGRFLQGPNLWPESLPAAEFKEPLEEYRLQMIEITELILEMLRQALPVPTPEGLFDEYCAQPTASLRLLHYPPQTSTDERQYGAGAHTDFGGITLLLQQPGTAGLEVFHPSSSSWIPVPAHEDRFVVNIGDLVNLWTGGYYLSALHRVRNRATTHRFSAPFFYGGNFDCTFVPLNLTGSEYFNGKAQTVGEHIDGKLTASIERLKSAEATPITPSVETELVASV